MQQPASRNPAARLLQTLLPVSGLEKRVSAMEARLQQLLTRVDDVPPVRSEGAPAGTSSTSAATDGKHLAELSVGATGLQSPGDKLVLSADKAVEGENIALRVLVLEADLAALRPKVVARQAGMPDPAILASKLAALETRVDIVSGSVSALRVTGGDSPRRESRSESPASKGGSGPDAQARAAALDARFGNVFEVLNSAQSFLLEAYNRLASRLDRLETGLAAGHSEAYPPKKSLKGRPRQRGTQSGRFET